MFPELSFLTNLAILWLYLLDYWWYFLLSVSPQSNQRCWFSYTYVDGWLVEQISGTGHSILLFHRESNSMLSLAPHPLQSIWADLFICTISPKICTQIDSQPLFWVTAGMNWMWMWTRKSWTIVPISKTLGGCFYLSTESRAPRKISTNFQKCHVSTTHHLLVCSLLHYNLKSSKVIDSNSSQ
jgi:hypothetical protein